MPKIKAGEKMSINAGSVYSELILDGAKYFAVLEKADKHMKSFENTLKTAGEKMESAGENLSKYVTAPIVALGAVSAKTAIDFESAFAGVRKTVDASEEDFTRLESGIRGMAKEIPASATAIAGVAEAAGQLGIETDNILGFTRVMIDLGEATNLSADEASTSFARFANIVGMSQQDFDRLGSVVVDLGNNLATTEAEIVNMAMRLAGAGAQIGLTEAQIMAFSGALSSVGIEAEAGGSAFSKVMIQMQLATETGLEGMKELEQLAIASGISIEGLQSAVRNGGNELKAVAGAMGMTNKELRSAYDEATKAKGSLEDFANVAGMSGEQFVKAFKEDAAGAIIAFIQGLANAEAQGVSAIKVLDDMDIKEVRLRDSLLRAAGASGVFNESLAIGAKAWEENNALTKEAEQRYETTASKIEIAKNYLTDAGITIGEIVVPHLVSLAEKVKNVADWFSNLNPKTQESIVKMAGLAAAAGPVLLVGGKLANGIGNIIGLYGKLSAATTLAQTATTGISTAASVAGGTAGLGGLAAGLGSAAVAAAPFVAAGVAVAGVGYLVHKGMSQEAVPAIDLFADKVEYVESRVGEYAYATAQSMETVVTTISESTKEAVSAYLELEESVTNTLDDIYINSTTITEQMKNELSEKYGEMANQINETLSSKRDEDIANLQEFFNESKAISETEESEILSNTEKYYSDKQKTVEEYEQEIVNIIQNASDEKRELTNEERSEINRIQEEMKTEAIKILSENEVEAGVILQRMKDYDERITAEQASDHIKKLNESRDKAVATANDEYEKRIATIIQMRDEAKVISSEQADKLLEDAKRQRDGIIEKAEDTRLGAIDKMREMNSDLETQVDTSTGKILTWWDKLKRWWSGWKPESKSFSYSTSETSRVGNNAHGTNYWRGGLTWVGEQGPELIELPRASKVHSNQKSMEMMTGQGDITNSFTVHAVIREESDIKKVAQELYRLQKGDERTRGTIFA